jgi:hypothetical protein
MTRGDLAEIARIDASWMLGGDLRDAPLAALLSDRYRIARAILFNQLSIADQQISGVSADGPGGGLAANALTGPTILDGAAFQWVEPLGPSPK